MRPRFSIIVPCCQIAGFIPDMAQSLLAQSFTDYEVLLVCEESTDDTAGQCRRLAAENPRWHFFQQCRSGSPATPRNTGLDHAEGQYILFLDGDDELTPETLAALDDALRRHNCPDLVHFAVVEFGECAATPPKRFFNFTPQQDETVLTGEAATVLAGQLHTNPWPMAGMTLCRRDFIEKHHLRFVPGLVHEDEEWTPRLLFLAQSVLILDRALYRYRQHTGSIMRGPTLRSLTHIATVVRSLAFFARDTAAPPAVWKAWQRSWLSMLYSALFFPKYRLCAADRERLAALQVLFADGGDDAFRKLLAHATAAKRLGGQLLLLANHRNHPLWIWPARFYFRRLFFPLILRQVKRSLRRARRTRK